MEIKIFSNYSELSFNVAKQIIELVKIKPNALLCLAAGHTSLGIFDELVKEHKNGSVDFSKVRFVGLDEWLGIGKDDDGSCERFMHINLFSKMSIPEENIIFYNGMTDHPEEECNRIEDYIKENGPIDFMLLGIGMNGHLGLNEPGVDFNSRSHVVELDKITKEVGQKYFKDKTNLEKGMTLGIQNIIESHCIVLIISGTTKRDIAQRLIASEVTNDLPASILKTLNNATIKMDMAAAEENEVNRVGAKQKRDSM